MNHESLLHQNLMILTSPFVTFRMLSVTMMIIIITVPWNKNKVFFNLLEWVKLIFKKSLNYYWYYIPESWTEEKNTDFQLPDLHFHCKLYIFQAHCTFKPSMYDNFFCCFKSTLHLVSYVEQLMLLSTVLNKLKAHISNVCCRKVKQCGNILGYFPV